MEEQRTDSINPHTGYWKVALWTIAVIASSFYVGWVHTLLYEIDILRFFWAYWVALVLYGIGGAGILFLIIMTKLQLLAILTLWRIRRYGIESLDKHTTLFIHNQNNTQSNED